MKIKKFKSFLNEMKAPDENIVGYPTNYNESIFNINDLDLGVTFLNLYKNSRLYIKIQIIKYKDVCKMGMNLSNTALIDDGFKENFIKSLFDIFSYVEAICVELSNIRKTDDNFDAWFDDNVEVDDVVDDVFDDNDNLSDNTYEKNIIEKYQNNFESGKYTISDLEYIDDDVLEKYIVGLYNKKIINRIDYDTKI